MAYSRTLNHFTSMQELATLWASSTSYVVNQLVINDDKLYRCLIAHTSTASFATDLGAGNWVEVSASASGVKNYITNGNFENSSTSGWNLARSTLDATTKLPNQASGSWTAAAGTLSRTIVTSGQLSGVASLSLASSAATTAGDMLVTDALTLDLEAQASVQTFSFYYRVTSGASNGNFSGTSSNSIGVAIYVVDGALAGTWIQPAGVWSVNTASSVTAVTAKAAGTFQVPSDATQVRLAVYFPNASTGAITVYLDDFVLGPQVVQYGAPVTDWQDFPSVAAGTLITGTSSNPSYGSTTHNKAQWRRVGGNMEIRWDYRQTTAGGAGSGAYLFNLPSGYSIDTTKVTATTGASTNDAASMSASVVGSGGVIGVGSTAGTLLPQVYDTRKLKLCIVPDAAQTYAYASSSFAPFSTSSLTFNFNASVPILGWSSSVQMSNDTDTRVVAARYYQASNTTQGANFLDWPTKDFDTHSAATTGSNVWKYTIPVAGTYRVTVEFSGVANSNIYLYKNGSQVTAGRLIYTQSTGNGNGSQTVSCVAGDYLQVSSGGANLYNGAICIERLSGPSAIAASESVNAKYRASAGQSIPNGAVTLVNWDTKDFDSHGAVTTGVGTWRFTAPISGKYRISGYVSLAAVAVTQSNRLSINLYKNGSLNITMGFRRFDGSYTANAETNFTGLINLVAGEYIDIRLDSGMPTTTMSTTTDVNWVGIERTGN